ncbi:hypothetical protein HOY80DRAFT_1021715 [Tuber brumale]|nr:hypothetical protein HOY80DRAFT_1021715 [Tuber brumale]
MGRKPAKTVKTVKTPKHITEIGMTPNQYFDLKVHIKSITLPGTPGFEGKRFASRDSEQVYRRWLDNALLELGPRFFPGGGKGLVWPEDYDGIYKAVHQVIRTLSYKIRKDHRKKMEGVMVVEGGTWNDETKVEIFGDGGGLAGHTDIGEDVVIDEEIGENQKQEKDMMVTEQYDHDKEATEEEIEAAIIELEDLLDLMKPEVFAPLPDLTCEDFDWGEVADARCPELAAGELSGQPWPMRSLTP